MIVSGRQRGEVFMVVLLFRRLGVRVVFVWGLLFGWSLRGDWFTENLWSIVVFRRGGGW